MRHIRAEEGPRKGAKERVRDSLCAHCRTTKEHAGGVVIRRKGKERLHYWLQMHTGSSNAISGWEATRHSERASIFRG